MVPQRVRTGTVLSAAVGSVTAAHLCHFLWLLYPQCECLVLMLFANIRVHRSLLLLLSLLLLMIYCRERL